HCHGHGNGCGHGKRRYHPGQGRPARHRRGRRAVPGDDAQHQAEPVLRVRLQRGRHSDRRGRAVSRVRAAAVPRAGGRRDGAVIGQRRDQCLAAAPYPPRQVAGPAPKRRAGLTGIKVAAGEWRNLDYRFHLAEDGDMKWVLVGVSAAAFLIAAPGFGQDAHDSNHAEDKGAATVPKAVSKAKPDAKSKSKANSQNQAMMDSMKTMQEQMKTMRDTMAAMHGMLGTAMGGGMGTGMTQRRMDTMQMMMEQMIEHQ